jgi:hypothetical protein
MLYVSWYHFTFVLILLHLCLILLIDMLSDAENFLFLDLEAAELQVTQARHTH